MSTISGFSFASGSTHSSGGEENIVKKYWNEYVKGILFGVVYTMAKESAMPKGFVIFKLVVEFIQIVAFCFMNNFKWGGIHIEAITSVTTVGYDVFTAGFWVCITLLALTIANVAYVGYTFYQGEVRSIFFLKTLRWACTLLVTILFIPIMYVMLAGLACDYSQAPAMLMMFPEVECWGTKHLAIGAVAPFFVVVFSIFALFISLTYYEFDPTLLSVSASLQNRFEFIALWVKILIVCVALFLSAHPVAFAVISFFSTFALLAAYVIMIPGYDRKMNLIRAGSYSGIFWVNICMLVAIAINDSKNYTSTVVLGVGLPFAIGLGVILADRRRKYVCNPRLVDGFVSELPIILPGPAPPPAKKSVKWEQPKANTLLRNQLYSHLLFPTDVEIAARFVLSKKPNQVLIEKAKNVYQTGLSKFPKSPTVLQAYVNFVFTVVGDWQMGYLALEKLRKMHPAIDIQFFIYRYDKDREQRSEGGGGGVGNFVEYMELKKLQQAAKRHHATALVCIRKFWRALLESKVDVMELSELSSRIATAEKKTAEQYARLLASYPKNVRVLRDYAHFLEEIAKDERTAHEIWKKADKYEEMEMNRITDSHRSQQQTPDAETAPEEDVDMSEIKSDHTSEYSFDDKSMTSASSGVTSGIAVARLDKNNKIKKLSWITFFVTLFVLAVTFTQLGVLRNQLTIYKSICATLDAAGGISSTAINSALLALDGFFIGIAALASGNPNFTYPYSGDFAATMASAHTEGILFGNDVKSVYWATQDSEPFTSHRRLTLKREYNFKLDIDPLAAEMTYDQFDHKEANKAELQNYMNSPNWNQSIWVYGNTMNTFETVESDIDIWNLAMLYNDRLGALAGASFAEFAATSTETKWTSNLYYIISNVWTLANASRGIIDLCYNNVDEQLGMLILECAIIFGASSALLITISVLLLRPVVNDIYKYKVRTLFIFTLIPSSVVKHMIKKKTSSLGAVAAQEDDITDDENEEQRPETGSEGEESDEEEEDEEVVLPPDADVPPPSTPRLPTPRTPRGSTKDANSSLLLPEDTPGGEEEEEGDDDAPLPPAPADNINFDAAKSPPPPHPLATHLVHAKTGTAKKEARRLSEPITLRAEDGKNPLINASSMPHPIRPSAKAKKNFAATSSLPHGTNRIVPTNDDVRPDEQRITILTEPSIPKARANKKKKRKMELSIKLPTDFLGTFAGKQSDGYAKLEEGEKKEKKEKKGKDEEEHSPATPGTPDAGALDKRWKDMEGKHSRMNMASLRAVMRKMHVKYVFAMFCCVVGLTVSFVMAYSFLNALRQSAYDFRVSDLRTQASKLIVFDLTAMFMTTGYPPALKARDNVEYELQNYWNLNEQSRVAQNYDAMTFMYGHECLRINKSMCANESYPYYNDVSNGLSSLMIEFYQLSNELLLVYEAANGSKPDNTNDAFVKLRTISVAELWDGTEYMTFLEYLVILDKISNAQTLVVITAVVEAILFILVRIFLLGPFVTKLREESEHTFAILRMIPRKMVKDIPEIKEFLRMTLDNEE